MFKDSIITSLTGLVHGKCGANTQSGIQKGDWKLYCKLFEGYLRNVILECLNENTYFTPYQHGFMRYSWCQTSNQLLLRSSRLDWGESMDVTYCILIYQKHLMLCCIKGWYIK